MINDLKRFRLVHWVGIVGLLIDGTGIFVVGMYGLEPLGIAIVILATLTHIWCIAQPHDEVE